MNVIEIKQGSPEWIELRRKGIGASDCPAVLGVHPYKTALQVYEEKVFGKEQYVSDAMSRGTILEPEAREWIEKRHHMKFDPICARSSEWDWQFASLDGYNWDTDTILEIKCPNEKTCSEVEDGIIPEYYKWQIQHQYAVTDAKNAILLVYNGKKGVAVHIPRDKSMVTKLTQEEAIFYDRMINYDPPEAKFDQRSDEEWREAVEEWKKAQSAFELSDEYLKICREGLVYLANQRSCRGLGVSVSRVLRKGNIEYSKVPQLKGVDLEPYRKPSFETWRVSASD